MQRITRVYKNLNQVELNKLLKKTKVRGAKKMGMTDVELDVEEHSSDKDRKYAELTHMYPTWSMTGSNSRTLLAGVSYFNVTMRYSI